MPKGTSSVPSLPPSILTRHTPLPWVPQAAVLPDDGCQQDRLAVGCPVPVHLQPEVLIEDFLWHTKVWNILRLYNAASTMATSQAFKMSSA